MEKLIAETLLSTRSDAIIGTDRDGIIRFWNPGAARVFGYATGSALGRSLDLIIPERLRKRHWDGFRHVIQTGQSRYDEGHVLAVPATREDGATISIEFTIAALRDEAGLIVGMAAIIRDVTQRFTELRELKQRLAEARKASA